MLPLLISHKNYLNKNCIISMINCYIKSQDPTMNCGRVGPALDVHIAILLVFLMAGHYKL